MLNSRTILSLIIFITSLFGGFFVTAFAPFSQENWFYFLGFRIFWQLGSTVWFTFNLTRLLALQTKTYSQTIFVLLATILGFVLCFNPILDLVRGPVIMQGVLIKNEIEYGTIGRRIGRSSTLHVRFQIKGEDGSLFHLEPVGFQAKRWRTMLAACRTSNHLVKVTALQHIDAVIEVLCK